MKSFRFHNHPVAVTFNHPPTLTHGIKRYYDRPALPTTRDEKDSNSDTDSITDVHKTKADDQHKSGNPALGGDDEDGNDDDNGGRAEEENNSNSISNNTFQESILCDDRKQAALIESITAHVKKNVHKIDEAITFKSSICLLVEKHCSNHNKATAHFPS